MRSIGFGYWFDRPSIIDATEDKITVGTLKFDRIGIGIGDYILNVIVKSLIKSFLLQDLIFGKDSADLAQLTVFAVCLTGWLVRKFPA